MELDYLNKMPPNSSKFTHHEDAYLLSEERKLLQKTNKKSRYGSFIPPSDINRTLQEYTCQPGDTLAGIALKFDTSIEQLKTLNKQFYYMTQNSLNVGEVIYISVKKIEKTNEVGSNKIVKQQSSFSSGVPEVKIKTTTENKEIYQCSLPTNNKKKVNSPVTIRKPVKTMTKNQTKTEQTKSNESNNLTDMLFSFNKNLSCVKDSMSEIEQKSVIMNDKNGIVKDNREIERFEIDEHF